MDQAPQEGLRFRLIRISRQMGAQHQRLRSLHSALQEACLGHGRDAPQACALYQDAIGAHFDLEERMFFPALHGLQPASQTELVSLEAEHEQLLRDLASLAALLTDPSSVQRADRLADFTRRLAAHEQREEALLATSMR